MNKSKPDNKPFELSIEEAKGLAQKFRKTEPSAKIESDPFSNEIAPSLLSSEHIKKYVKATGLIAPFSADTSKNGRLKKASYAGRLGEIAYNFEVPNDKEKKSGNDLKTLWKSGEGNLILPPNSIVFVECDLEFRLPNFIALRFNLAITHVHRGLLLGTGPLVDPGFWGKLCIPLHNLTDEPYEISKEDDLIWLEFTKTTSSEESGRLPSGSGYWDIKKFIERAQKQVDEQKDRVGIRSGISQALADSKTANTLVKVAEKAAKKASASATEAKNKLDASIKSSFFWGTIGVLFTIVSVAAAFTTLTAMYYSDMNAQFKDIRPSIESLEESFKGHTDSLDVAGQSEDEAKASISKLSGMVTDLNKSIAGITSLLNAEHTARLESEERAQLEKIESDRRIDALIGTVSELCRRQTGDEPLDICSKMTVEPVE